MKSRFFLLLFTFSKLSFGQTATAPITVDVFPPTPNAAAFAKFVDVPVNFSTGIPQIGIPIYDYKGQNGLSFSVSLTYHAGGVKLEEIASDVGIGWALNAGGQVTRTIRGLQDDLPQSGYFYIGGLKSAGQYLLDYCSPFCGVSSTQSDTALYVYSNLVDGQSDVFSYSINGKSGRFVYGFDGSIVTIPQSKIKIQRLINPTFGSYKTLYGFVITDVDGTKYYFTQSDDISSQLQGNVTPGGFSYASTWNLTKIIAPFNTDSISLSYEPFGISYQLGYSETNYCATTSLTPNQTSQTTNTYTGTSNRIKTISFPDSTLISFTYEQVARKDISAGGALQKITISNSKNSRGYQLWHSYGSNGAYDPAPANVSSTLRLQLDSVAEFSGTTVLPPYKMTYNGTLADRLSLSQDYWGFYYNPGRANSNTLIPVLYRSPDAKLDGADRRPDSTYTKVGILTNLQYPTGGSTTFDYEINKAGDGKLNQLVGQLATIQGGAELATNGVKNFTLNRPYNNNEVIKLQFKMLTWCPGVSTGCVFNFAVKTSDGLTTIASTTFGYSELGTTKTIQLGSLANGNYQITWNFTVPGSCTCNDVFGFSLSWNQYQMDSAQLAGGLRIRKIITYDGVSHANDLVKEFYYEKQNGASSGTIRLKPRFDFTIRQANSTCFAYGATNYTVRTSAANYPLSNINGAPVVYSRVVVKEKGGSSYLGQSVYNFTDYSFIGAPSCTDGSGGNCFPFADPVTLDYGLGLLLSEEHYDSNNHLLKRIRNVYNYVETDRNYLDKFRSIKFGTTGQQTQSMECGKRYEFAFTEYFPLTGRAEKIKEFVAEFSPSQDSIVKETDYTYDTTYYNLKSVYTFNSKNQKIEQRLYYPYDYTLGGAVGSLRDSGIIAPIISTEEWLTDGSTSSMRDGSIIDYSFITSKVIKPSVYYKLNNATLISQSTIGSFNPSLLNRNTQYFVSEVTYNKYDPKGNVVEYSDKSGTTTIIWDVNKQYPVARIRNADSAYVAYTSFESDGTGNWNVSDTFRLTEGLTGDKSFALNGTNSISFSNTSSNLDFILSYWSKDGTINVGGATSLNLKTGLTKNGWTYYEHKIRTTGTNISLTAGSLKTIDELRLYPAGAQMLTYTYAPVIGVTSQCSINSLVSYYNYDQFGRLKFVRDMDGNIIKSFEYNYKQ